jgi:hypothetical protein
MMRLITDEDSPVDLWFRFKIVQVELRLKPSAAAWASKESKPDAMRASRSSAILAHCFAFKIERDD